MSRIEREAVARARRLEASMFKARVPSGSISHLSGNRFAAPDVGVSRHWGSCEVVIEVRSVHVQCITTSGLSRHICQRTEGS